MTINKKLKLTKLGKILITIVILSFMIPSVSFGKVEKASYTNDKYTHGKNGVDLAHYIWTTGLESEEWVQAKSKNGKLYYLPTDVLGKDEAKKFYADSFYLAENIQKVDTEYTGTPEYMNEMKEETIKTNNKKSNSGTTTSSSSSSSSSSDETSPTTTSSDLSWSSIVKKAKDFINKGNAEKKIDQTQVENDVMPLAKILMGFAILTLLITGAILGVKYMIAGADEKADIKQRLVWYVVAAVLIFGAVAIYNISVSILNNVNRNL